MTKAPTPAEISKGQSDNTNNATKKLNYTPNADQLRMVSWSIYGHRFTGTTFQLPVTAVLSKGHTFKNV